LEIEPAAVGELIVVFLAGAALTFALLRARQGILIEKAKSELAIELASMRERAGRVPVLEARITDLQAADQARQGEMLGLSRTEAEKSRLLQSTEEQLVDVRAQLARAEKQLTECAAELTTAKQRQATFASEASRIPALEGQIKQFDETNLAMTRELVSLRESFGRVAAEVTAERELSSTIRSELEAARTQLAAAQNVISQLSVEKADLTARLETEREQAAEKLQLLNEAKETLTDQFKSLANDILEDKSRRFVEQNQTNLGQLLDPLKSKLTEFQLKVEDVYIRDTRERTALGEQVRQLMALNQSISTDAKNLTQALKGSNRTQGTYGELVLERVLESSGLRKGEEYEAQASHTREDGSRAQPDVVIRLPENRNLVVDSKVSLLAYDESVAAECEGERAAAIARHIASVRAHIKGLADKNYQSLYQLKSLDFVLMFVPIEPAFMLAVTHDRDLFMEAWNRNVLLVSPSTLMFVVRTVAHLWRQEAQSRNAQEIAKRGAELYDRLQAFVTDLEKVGERLRQAQDSFNDARDKLSKNKGNVIRQAEMLKRLGVKPTKELPIRLVELAMDADIEEHGLLGNGIETDGQAVPVAASAA
jgi:DNA recombination protein RmuC